MPAVYLRLLWHTTTLLLKATLLRCFLTPYYIEKDEGYTA